MLLAQPRGTRSNKFPLLLLAPPGIGNCLKLRSGAELAEGCGSPWRRPYGVLTKPSNVGKNVGRNHLYLSNYCFI